MPSITTNQQQAKLIEYIQPKLQELQRFRSLFTNGQTTYNDVSQILMTEQNQEAQRIAAERNAEKQATQALAEDERNKADHELVLQKYPDMQHRLDNDIAAAKKMTQERTRIINNFFELDEAGLNDFLQSDHEIFESPCQWILTNHEFVQNNRKQVEYTCDVCFGEQFYSLESAERHCWTEEDHKQRAINYIQSLDSTEVIKLRSHFKSDIQERAYQLRNADNIERLKAEKEAAAKHQKQIEKNLLVSEKLQPEPKPNTDDLKIWPPSARRPGKLVFS